MKKKYTHSLLYTALSALCLIFLSSELAAQNHKTNREHTETGDLSRLELPALSGSSDCYFVTHHAGGEVNYSVEYDTRLHSPRFVAFTFDNKNSTKLEGVKRTEAWSWNPFIPSRYETDRSWYKGYSRGHLVASNDRQQSIAANKQTFYYTNIVPQYAKHNTGIWKRLESLVQKWGRNPKMRDVLYVAKGVTLGENQIIDYTRKGIVVPRYFWMAIVCQKGDKYYGLAFLSEHHENKVEGRLDKLTLSIKELEEVTGMDFFPNFPDKIERDFERQDPMNYTHLWQGL